MNRTDELLCCHLIPISVSSCPDRPFESCHCYSDLWNFIIRCDWTTSSKFKTECWGASMRATHVLEYDNYQYFDVNELFIRIFFFFNSVCGRLSLPLFCYYWSPDYQYVAGISCRFLSFSLFAPAELLFGKIHIQTTEIVCLPSKFKTNENIVIRRNWQIKLPIIVIIVTVTVAALCNPFIKSQ